MTTVLAVLGVALGGLSLAWQAYTWSRAGPKVVVSAQFTHYFAGVERGGNHFALEVTVFNQGRGPVQVVDWSLVSRGNKLPDGRRVGVTARWGDGPVPTSDQLPTMLQGYSRARWTISLVDDVSAYPTLDQLIPDNEARVEVHLGSGKRPPHSDWFPLPPRSSRRSSHEIALADREHRLALQEQPQSAGFRLVDLLIDPPE